MVVGIRDGLFIAQCTFEERNIPKNAGFKWDGASRLWHTSNEFVANRLFPYCNEAAREAIASKHIRFYPEETCDFQRRGGDCGQAFDFQLHAARFALFRSRSYLGLDPGLGKTIVAALISNALRLPVVYVCPPFLATNVSQEFKKWCEHEPVIITDTKISDVVVEAPFLTTLIVDEAHRFKNERAERTRQLFELCRELPWKRIIFMSGTPMPNRPMELFTILSNEAPEVIDGMNRHQFGVKYCAAYRNQWGWDYGGSSNVEELAERLKGTFMLRLRKEDVLKELPPKLEEMVFIEDEQPATVTKLEQEILKHFSPEDLTKENLAAELGKFEEELHISTYRKMLGTIKAKSVAKHVAALLEDNENEKILVFAIHKMAIEELTKRLKKYKPVVIDGSVPTKNRQSLVNEFQRDASRRVAILNITAGGVGFNMQQANRVIFAEFSWVPGENDQAIDRAHRIGQTVPVTAQYLVYANSLDATVLGTIFKKKRVTRHI